MAGHVPVQLEAVLFAVLHNRRSPRLDAYDYRRPGWYFVTVCTANRALVFGDVVGADVVLSDVGRIAEAEWMRTLAARPYLVPDAFVVMPNHVHVLFGMMPGDWTDVSDRPELEDMARHVPTHSDPTAPIPSPIYSDADPGRRDMACHVPAPPDPASVRGRRAFAAPVARSVSSVVGSYKSAVTREANRLWGRSGPGLWQGRYHDRIVRDEGERARIRQYILDNPLRWHLDPLKP